MDIFQFLLLLHTAYKMVGSSTQVEQAVFDLRTSFVADK